MNVETLNVADHVNIQELGQVAKAKELIKNVILLPSEKPHQINSHSVLVKVRNDQYFWLDPGGYFGYSYRMCQLEVLGVNLAQIKACGFTHLDADHCGLMQKIQSENHSVEAWITEEQNDLLRKKNRLLTKAYFYFDTPAPMFRVDRIVNDKQVFLLGDTIATVKKVGGHSPADVVWFMENVNGGSRLAVMGDFLHGCLGYGSDYLKWLRNQKKLSEEEFDICIDGHGDEISLPYVRGVFDKAKSNFGLRAYPVLEGKTLSLWK